MPNVPERRTSVKAEGGASRTRIEERFWTNTGLSLATRIVTAALSLATIPVVIDRLGLIDFGIWEALLAFASLAVILQTAVSGTLVWRISDAYGQGDAATIHRMTGLGVAASLGLFLLLWPPLWWLREPIVRFLGVPAETQALAAQILPVVSYCSSDSVARSGKSAAYRTLAATRPANVVPLQVMTGSPIHSASDAVVCALYRSVSRNKSASRWRAR